MAEVPLLQEAEGLGFRPPCAAGEPQGGPGQSPGAWSQQGQRKDHPAPEARCRRCPVSSPHQPSASLRHDPPLPPAVVNPDPPGLATLPPSRTFASSPPPPQSCQHVVSRTRVVLGSLGPCPSPSSASSPGSRAGGNYVLPSWTQPGWSATGPDLTVPSRRQHPGVCPRVSPCRDLSTHHVRTRPRAPGHRRLAVPGGDAQAAAPPSRLSDIPEHRASAHETYSLEGALNSLTIRQRRLTGPKTPPHGGPENTSPAACDQHQPAASFRTQNPC